MKVWFEGDMLYYDAVINGITPNWIKLDTVISELKFDGKHAYIKGTPTDAIVHDLDNYLITRVVYQPHEIT